MSWLKGVRFLNVVPQDKFVLKLLKLYFLSIHLYMHCYPQVHMVKFCLHSVQNFIKKENIQMEKKFLYLSFYIVLYSNIHPYFKLLHILGAGWKGEQHYTTIDGYTMIEWCWEARHWLIQGSISKTNQY